MTAIFKHLTVLTLCTVFWGCSTHQKNKKPLFVIKIDYMDGVKKSCSLKFLTEAKQRAEVTANNKSTKCTLTAMVKKVDNNGYKLSIKFKHLMNDVVVSELSPTLKGVFDEPITSEVTNLKNKHKMRFIATVSKTGSL